MKELKRRTILPWYYKHMAQIDLGFTSVKQPLPDFIHRELLSYVIQSNSYHHQPDELRGVLAKKHGVSTEDIFLTAGADQAIMLLCALYGKSTHIFTPTYISYTDTEKLGGSLTEHYSLKGDVYDISAAGIEGASLVFLANPNNPAGLTSRHQVLELVRANPHTIVVVDETYADFANESV